MLFVSDLKWIVMLSTFLCRALGEVFSSLVRGVCRALDAVVSFRRKKLLATYLLMNR